MAPPVQLRCCCFRPEAKRALGDTASSTYTHTCLTALCPGLRGWAGTRKVKPIWILLKQERVSGSGISWAICKSASRSRQITTPAPTTQFFTGRMPFLPPNQQHQSTEGFSSTYSRINYSCCCSSQVYTTYQTFRYWRVNRLFSPVMMSLLGKIIYMFTTFFVRMKCL